MINANKKHKHPIMVVTDEPEDEKVLRHILGPEFSDLHFESDIDSALSSFVDLAPEILIMAFPEISSAESFYLGLFRTDENAAAKIRHQSLILCHSQETEVAYKLCKKRVFDDYVVFHPLQDPNRLKLSIDQAIERIGLQDAAKGFAPALAGVSEGIGELNGFLGTAIGAGKKIGQNLSNATNNLSGDMDHQIKSLRKILADHQFDGGNKLLDDSKVLNHLESLAKLANVVKKDGMASTDIATWFNDFEKKSNEQVAAIEEMVKIEFEQSILVIEDDEFTQDIYRLVLGEAGYVVFIAGDGYEALRHIHQKIPDLILVDIILPDIDGIEIIRRIRLDPQFVDIPIIVASGHAEKAKVQSAFQAGARDFVVKPIEKQILLEKLKRHLK